MLQLKKHLNSNKDYTMNLDTKLKTLTVASLTGTLATTMSLVMIPVLQKRYQVALAATTAVAGTVVVVGCLKTIHKIDLQMNEENNNV